MWAMQVQNQCEICRKVHDLLTGVCLDHGQKVCSSGVSSRVLVAVCVRALKTSALWPRAVHSKEVNTPSWKLTQMERAGVELA